MLHYNRCRVTNVLQIKEKKSRATEFSAALQKLFKQKHGAGLFCPAVLCHILAMKLGLSRFEITDIITLDKTCVNTVTWSLMAKNILCSDRLQRVFQIHYQLAQIRGILCIIHIIREQSGTYLPCCHSCSLSINQKSKQLL